VVARKDCIDYLRNHSVVVANDAGKNRRVLAELRNQIVAKLVFHTAGAQFVF
jgi:hypothetical protein